MVKDVAAAIKTMAEEPLREKGQYVVDVIVSERRTPRKILVILDGERDVTIDDCALLSRYLTEHLDDGAMPEEYRLEVSSPGLDQPLKLKEQYRKNVGRLLRATTEQGIVEGELIEATENEIVIRQRAAKKQEEPTPVNINYSQILKAFVLPKFK
jgi:ribosome maturation factor RimP